MKTIIISAVNLTEAGPLTILQNCLSELSSSPLSNQYRIIAIVHDKRLCDYPAIEYIEMPQVKQNWIRRVYAEYITFKEISKQFRPFLWLSLHDMTPNVIAEKRVVYCHNLIQFYYPKWRDIIFSYKVVLFAYFYKYLYRINIKKNNYIAVQHNWMREAFSKIYGLHKKKIIVTYPLITENKHIRQCRTREKDKIYRFFYPAFPRPFKNFELIGKAVEHLQQKGVKGFEVILTIKGNENNYAKWIVKKYSKLTSLCFIGLQAKREMEHWYTTTDCMLFPSKLETWGLPISEFATYGKPILVADVPYAHEATSNSVATAFFNPDDAQHLADAMELLIKGDMSELKKIPLQTVEQPFSTSWNDFFNIILNETP